jgi:hypothetical protein
VNEEQASAVDGVVDLALGEPRPEQLRAGYQALLLGRQLHHSLHWYFHPAQSIQEV